METRLKAHIPLFLVVASLLVAGCVPIPQASVSLIAEPNGQAETAAVKEAPTTAVAAAAATGVIPVEALMNATYSGIYDEPVKLTDGLYEGEPFVKGDASHPVVEYVDGAELYGDLNGDGIKDAVVFLHESSGGSGFFTYVAAQLNRDGKPVDAGAVVIEDRIGVKSAAIKDGQIALEIITQGPGDVACCSTHRARKTYALREGRLAETTPKDGDLIRVSEADLDGTGWTLLELNHDQPAIADSNVTISFHDGRITGFGGCNEYAGSFNLGEENPLVMTIGPLVATQKSCPEPVASQETAYFTALEGVSHWGYVFGRLGLYYDDGQDELGRLLFGPQPASESAQADALTGQSWQWVSFTNPVEQFDVEAPQSYQLTFNGDGTVDIVADCNNAAGSYTDEDGALTIAIGPMTMAACPPESRSDQFIRLLGGAARCFFEEGNLYIDLFADGGTLAFAPVAK
jgi:heat shock protein HslJ